MADKTRPKRLPKGQRIHARRLKQVARKAGTAYSQPPSALHPVRILKTEAEHITG